MKIKLAVLFGGQSNEHLVSCMSVTSVLQNLADEFDVYMVGITKEGKWFHYCDEVSLIENDKWLESEKKEEIMFSTDPQHHGFTILQRVPMTVLMSFSQCCTDVTVKTEQFRDYASWLTFHVFHVI